MTEHVHDWGEWEEMVSFTKVDGEMVKTHVVGDRARWCRSCDQWEIEWAEDAK